MHTEKLCTQTTNRFPYLSPLRQFFDEKNAAKGANRYATMLTFLDTVEEGGETVFTKVCVLGLKLNAGQGRGTVCANGMSKHFACTKLNEGITREVETGCGPEKY
eukprot:1147463-Pelagomonas_calceolata.AAC.6